MNTNIRFQPTNTSDHENTSNSSLEISLVLLLLLIFVILKLCLLLAFVPGPTASEAELIFRNTAESIFGLKGFAESNGNFAQPYAPLYPLLLSLSFLLSAEFFKGMLAINSMLTALAIFPLWLLSRLYFGKSAQLFLIILLMLMPFHFFNAHVASENLLCPLVALLAWILFQPQRDSRTRYMLIGLLLALSILTDFHIFPLLLVVLGYVLIFDVRLRAAGKILNTAYLLLGVITPIACWIAFGNASIVEMFKAITMSSQGGPIISPSASTLSWFLYYGDFMVLAAGLWLAPTLICILRSQMLPKPLRHLGSIFLVAVGIMSLVGIYLSTFHGLIFGNYLGFLFPPLILPIVWVVENGRATISPETWKRTTIAAGALIACCFLHISFTANSSLIGGIGSIFAHQFGRAPLGGAASLLIITILLAIYASLGFHEARVVFLRAILMGYFVVIAVPHFAVNLLGRDTSLVAKTLAKVLHLAPEFSNPITVYSYRLPKSFSPGSADFARQISFFFSQVEVDRKNSQTRDLLTNSRPESSRATPPITVKEIVTTTSPLTTNDQGPIIATQACGHTLATANIFGKQLYFSWFIPDGEKDSSMACTLDKLPKQTAGFSIINWGPRTTKTGERFNPQPNGTSAMWFKTTGASSSTILSFNGSILPVIISSSELVTASIPDELFSEPGRYEIYLRDQDGETRSNSVYFVVR